jgi:hypothetical protein
MSYPLQQPGHRIKTRVLRALAKRAGHLGMVDLNTICSHEAAHAVMRYLVGLPVTSIIANTEGGYCYGSGRPCSVQQSILSCLAGIAYEAGCIPSWVDLAKSKFDDLEEAKRLISFTSRELSWWFERACGILWPYSDDIEQLGEWLEIEETLSAKRIAGFLCRRGLPRGKVHRFYP